MFDAWQIAGSPLVIADAASWLWENSGATDGDALTEVHYRVLRAPLTRDLLVRLGDVNDLRDTRQCLEAR